MARPSNTAERRAQIANGLMKVMAKRGYDGATIADVAAAARLTPGLVHYHFKDKREILLAALEQLVASHDERLNAVMGGTQSVNAFLDFHLGLGRDADPQAMACWILMTGEALRDAKVRALLGKALNRMAARLEKEVGRDAAAALVALIHGYYMLSATARTLIPKGSAARTAKKMAAGLLR